MNAAIYARVSTAAQAEHGYSLETQIEACRNKAIEMGATSIKEYVDDGYSGAYLERPKLDELRDAVSAKLHDTIIIYDIDRLSRDTMHLLLLTEEFEKNATLVYVNSEYNKTPEGQLFFEIRGSFAKYERIKIQDRFQRGMRGKLRKGLPISNHNVFGYDWDGKNYIVNETQAEIVRKCFDLYLNTLGGYRNVKNWLNEQGIPSPKGYTKWSDYGVMRLLKRSMYTGEYYAYTVYHKKISAKHFTYIKRDRAEWIPMTCPAIISKNIFEKTQEKLNRNKQQKIRETKHTSLLNGVLYCASCGRKMRACIEPRRKHPYSFYQCYAVAEKDSSCKNHSVSSDIVDKFVWTFIDKICRDEKLLKKYIAENQPKATDTTDAIQKELQNIETKRQAIMNWFSANLITANESTTKLQMLKKQEKSLRSKLLTKKEKINTAEIVSTVKENVTFEQKRNFILSNIKKILLLRKDFDNIKNVELEIKLIFRS